MKIERVVRSNLSTDAKKRLYEYISSLDAGEMVKLPAESRLAEQMGVSRVTIRRTLDDLENEGLVIRIHGRGTFINPEAANISVNLIPGEEFLNLIRRFGWKAHCEVMGVRREVPGKKVAEALNLAESEEVWRIEKVYYADNEPCIISVDQIPAGILPESVTDKETLRRSIFAIMRERSGVIILRDKITIEALSSEETKPLLKDSPVLPCSCTMVFHGINYDEQNAPVMYDTEIYDTSKIKFSLMRVKNP